MKSFCKRRGFSLIELMIVVAIIACLSVIVTPSLMKLVAKAKRAEAYVVLRSLALAQKAYFAEFGHYTTNLFGAQGLSWKPEGNYNYTYGFSGAAGHNHFVGQLKTPASALQGAHITSDGFTAYAAGDIDGDGEPDILSIDQDNVIKIVKDDLM